MPKALIIGINGMDGSHLADLLSTKPDYKIYGLERSTQSSRHNIKQIESNIEFVQGDIMDQQSLVQAINNSQPDEIYNLAAQSFLEDCWNSPEINANIIGMGVLRLLEAVKKCNKKIKVFQAGSSEMFGSTETGTANELTEFRPKTPYGAAKLYAYWLTQHYKNYHDMFVCNGILFNHESERRKIQFLTRKVTNGVAKIALGLSKTISIGNLFSSRDWGYAPDFVEGMWKIMQNQTADTYVLATGQLTTIEELLTTAFNAINITDWSKYVVVDDTFCRPSEVAPFKGDFSKAKTNLNWQPKIAFKQMIANMVNSDINLLNQ